MHEAPDSNPTRNPGESTAPSSPTLLHSDRLMEAISRLAGGLAHDFNNLLTVISGHTELLLHSLEPNDALRRHAEAIRTSASRAAFLTNELLAFSRRQILVPRLLDLNGLIATMRESLQKLLAPEIQLATQLESGIGSVHLDPSRIERALTTLVQHARDVMAEGGTVTVQTATVPAEQSPLVSAAKGEATACVMIAVSDTGPGMDEETLARIFEPFFVVPPGKGSGLGLATVHGIVHQSGGKIRVRSKPGHGTTFQLFFPRADQTPTPVAAAGTAAQPAAKPQAALLVEDEAQVRVLLSEVLRAKGFQVLAAADAAEALRLSEKHSGPIDILVTDVMMPGMNGKELADRLQADCADLHVLFMSGYAADVLDAESTTGSKRGFLQKPFTPDDLIRKVREMLASG